jgi:amino acid transporter
MVGIGLAGTVLAMIPLVLSDHAQFVSAFERVAGSGSYQTVLGLGTDAGVLPLPEVSLGATLLAVAMAASGLAGATWSTYTAGELKQGRSVLRQSATMMVPLALTMIFWTLIPALLDRVAGHDFIVALNGAYASDPSKVPLPGVGFPVPFHVVFGSILSGNAIVAILIAIGHVAWFLALMPAFVMGFIRCVFAWSFDGLMPKFLADVDPKTNVPFKATITVLVLAELGVLLWSYNPGIFSAQVAYYAAVFFFTFSIAGLAAMLFPYVRPRLYENSPIAGYKIGPLPFISIAGFVTLVFSLYVGWINLTEPVLGVTTDLQRAMPVIIMALGFVVYFAAIAIRRMQGRNLDLVFKEIPPD